MPYRMKGNSVQVKKGGKWRTLKSYRTRKKALAYFRALQANVRHR